MLARLATGYRRRSDCPSVNEWTERESNPPTDLARISRPLSFFLGEHASPYQRSVRELNPVFVHTTDACCRNTYRPCESVIADGIEPSIFCMSRRRLRRWTTRSCLPSSRDRSRTCKITWPSTKSLFRFAYSTNLENGGSRSRTWPSELMRLS